MQGALARTSPCGARSHAERSCPGAYVRSQAALRKRCKPDTAVSLQHAGWDRRGRSRRLVKLFVILELLFVSTRFGLLQQTGTFSGSSAIRGLPRFGCCMYQAGKEICLLQEV